MANYRKNNPSTSVNIIYTSQTSYDKLKELVSLTEYEDLPCIYLEAVLTKNECVLEDFIEILKLYREQYKYLEI